MILLSILLFILISAWIDWQHLSIEHYIYSHTSRWLLRALFVLSVANDVKEVIGMTLLFIALFDTLLNYFLSKEVFYLGKVALWDRFWMRIPFLYISFKVVSLFVGVYLLILS